MTTTSEAVAHLLDRLTDLAPQALGQADLSPGYSTRQAAAADAAQYAKLLASTLTQAANRS